MNELVTINENERFPVDAKELYRKLEVRTPYHKWIQRRISDGLLIEGVDYQILGQKSPKIGRGRPANEYQLSFDGAKNIALMERTEIGKKIRMYFISIEREYREGPFAGKEIARQWVNEKQFLSYNAVLRALGMSQRSSSYSARRRKYPTEFVKINKEWFVSMEMAMQIWRYAEVSKSQKALKAHVARVLESRKGLRQLAIF